MKPCRTDGDTLHFEVSNADFDQLSTQIEDAISFLQRYKTDLEVLMALPGVSGVLDFAVATRHLPTQFGRLSPDLVCRAGKAGLGLELSLYWTREGEGAEA